LRLPQVTGDGSPQCARLSRAGRTASSAVHSGWTRRAGDCARRGHAV